RTTQIRVEGFEKSVAYRAAQLQSVLAPLGEATIVSNDGLWKSVRDVERFHALETAVWRISVRPSDGANVAKTLEASNDTVEIVFDWGGGLIWASTPADLDVRAVLNGISGYAECVRGTHTKRVPQNAAIAKIEQGLRAKFDPNSILNAGIMG
ncbi:MAG: glycolate oxidase subunit GlcE, partial [Amylibacter sp.]